MDKFVCLQPCLGINDATATVARQACYLVAEDLLPGQVHLGCAPALNADVQEDIDFIMNDYVICIEGCDKACATALVKRKGGRCDLVVNVQEALKQAGIDLCCESPEFFPTDHPAVQALAKTLEAECNKALSA